MLDIPEQADGSVGRDVIVFKFFVSLPSCLYSVASSFCVLFGPMLSMKKGLQADKCKITVRIDEKRVTTRSTTWDT